MSLVTPAPQRVSITEQTVKDVQHTAVPLGAEVVLRAPDGSEHHMPDAVQAVLLQAMSALAQHGNVTIGQLPEELTSTVAADLLGVSRPTLMKWAHDGAIDSFAVGTHTRFRREDVLTLRQSRERARAEAVAALRSFDDEHPELVDD